MKRISFYEYCQLVETGLPINPSQPDPQTAMQNQNKLRLAQNLAQQVQQAQSMTKGANVDPSKLKPQIDKINTLNQQIKKIDANTQLDDAKKTAVDTLRNQTQLAKTPVTSPTTNSTSVKPPGRF